MTIQKQDDPKPHSIIDNPDVEDLQLEVTLAGLLEDNGSFTLTAAGRALFEDPGGSDKNEEGDSHAKE